VRLLIVESPNKISKIKGFIGPEWQVAASFGHVRDLPVSGDLAVTFADGAVLPQYVPLEKAGRAISTLRSLAARADDILLATDPDREGEAIAWHIAALISDSGKPIRRVTFHSITKAAVQAALAAPRPIDQHLVDAQQARRVLDRVVGWVVSPTLKKVAKEAKSAGRVQSVALRLVAEREAEIAAFNAVDYCVLRAKLDKPGSPPPFTADLIQWKGEALGQRLTDPAIAEQTVAWCRKQAWVVQSCERRERSVQPPPPFITATVQQAASVRLGLDPAATMKLLQELFEGGHITYHRTDSTALDPEAVQAARAIIRRDLPPTYLPAQPVDHGAKANANAQEAHEAIRPTHPDEPPALAGQAAALYALIRDRFLACQAAPARDAITTLDVACAPGAWQGGPMGVFRAKGTVVLFDGWRRLTGGDATDETPQPGAKKRGRPKKDAEDNEEAAVTLPLLDPGATVDLSDLLVKKKSTKPPPRYTQASLIKALERAGVGRPSTYAAILGTILARGYVSEVKRMLHASDLGCAVTTFLKARYAGNFIELQFTAGIEERLDRIARGELPWQAEVTREAFAIRDLARKAGLWFDPFVPRPPTAQT
jgi:DNA topoisomerase-1